MMLGRVTAALQQAVDTIAPGPTPLEDFVYRWKQLLKHFMDVSSNKHVAVELTSIPFHFDCILKLLLKEDEEMSTQGVPGPCLEYLLQNNLLEYLVTFASTDEPPGMRQYVFSFMSKFINQMKSPFLGHSGVFPSLQRLVSYCDGATPTPTELDEVQFLLGLSAFIRRCPFLIPVFTSPINSEGSSHGEGSISGSDVSGENPPNNALFVTPLATSGKGRTVRILAVPDPPPPPPPGMTEGIMEDPPKNQDATEHNFILIESLLSYIDSPDCRVRVKACQALILLVSLPDDKICLFIVQETLLCNRLTTRLASLFYCIPSNTDPNHVDQIHLTWGLDVPASPCVSCEGCRQVACFLTWFDFCDQVLKEANPKISEGLTESLFDDFASEAFAGSLTQPLFIALLSKCIKMISSQQLKTVFGDWLHQLKDCEPIEETPAMRVLLSNWISPDSAAVLETFRFFEVYLDKYKQEALQYLLSDKCLCSDTTCCEGTESSDKQSASSDATYQIEHTINSLLLVVESDLRTNEGSYEQYVGESQRQLESLLPLEGSKETSCPFIEKDQLLGRIKNSSFFSSLFKALNNIPRQSYEVNLELTGVVSRLVLLADEELFKLLLSKNEGGFIQPFTGVIKVLSQDIVLVPHYKTVLFETRQRLLGNLPSDSGVEEGNCSFENIIVIEELCKELAAIAHVKDKYFS